MKVLICEDNFVVALDMQEQVREIGHEPLGFVTRSSECLSAVERTRPDVVLVDLSLADGRTGPKLLETLSEMGVPSIVVSGEYGFLPDDHGAVAVIEKPLHVRQLVRALSLVPDDRGLGEAEPETT